jgi:23S rRNA (uracil1939-C5)-methyltransferase
MAPSMRSSLKSNSGNLLNSVCQHFDACSGCSQDLLPECYSEQSALFTAIGPFFESKGIKNFKLHQGTLIHWRTRAKLAVRGVKGQITIGIFKGNSHEVMTIPACQVHHPLINKITKKLTEWLNTLDACGYEESTGKGLLRHLQLSVYGSPSLEKVQIVFVLNHKDEKFLSAISQFWEANQSHLHSIWMNLNTRRDNVIFGEEWALLFGERVAWTTFLGQEIAMLPQSFMQANPVMFERLLSSLRRFIPPESSILEFYAGAGVIGLTLVDLARKIIFNEISSVSKECFDLSVSNLSLDIRQKLFFFAGKAEDSDLLKPTSDIDVVIVDPPRKGVDKELLAKIVSVKSIRRLIYVSCGFESFKRDAEFLVKSGFSLHHAESFLFFPGTDQLEILAVFES